MDRYISYQEKFKDVRWQKKRLEMFSRDEWSCRICNKSIDMNVQLHHKNYIKGRDPWDYADIWFISVCDECHEMIKNRNKPKINITEKSGKNDFRIIEKTINCYLESIENNYSNHDNKTIINNIRLCLEYGLSCFKDRENRYVREEFMEKRKIFSAFRKSIKNCDCESFQSCEKCNNNSIS